MINNASLRYTLSITLILQLCLFASVARASDLDDILKSAELKRYQQLPHQKMDKSGLTPGTNLYDLFDAHETKPLIDLWYEIPDGIYKLTNSRVLYKETTRGSIRTYTSKSGIEILMHVLVPHPRQAESARFRLLPEYAELTRMKVKFAEDIEVAGRKAQLLTLPDNSCQINVDLTKAALVTFKSDCKNTDALVEFIKLTSLDRFEEKLNS